MKIGVISDSHDNIPKVKLAVHYLNEIEPVDVVIHAGDFVAPFVVKELMALKAEFHGVFGNNDGEREGINSIMPNIKRPPLRLEFEGKKIVVTHDIGKLKRSDLKDTDIVIYGHSHRASVETKDGKLYVNPGEIGGWITGSSSLAIIDPGKLTAEITKL